MVFNVVLLELMLGTTVVVNQRCTGAFTVLQHLSHGSLFMVGLFMVGFDNVQDFALQDRILWQTARGNCVSLSLPH